MNAKLLNSTSLSSQRIKERQAEIKKKRASVFASKQVSLGFTLFGA
jgi:hypothetical protein